MLPVPPSAFRLPPSLRTWWTILRISLEERLVYRGDFMLGTLMRFLPFVTQIFLWNAVFSVVPGSIAGYTKNDIIAYYLLTNVSRAFSSMPGLASGISRSILDGSIKKYLIQPVDMIGFLFITRTAHKLVYYTVAFVPFALVFFLCRGFFTNGWPPLPTVIAFLASLVMAFVLGFFLESTIGMIGFWFLEVNSLLFVYMLLNFFLSGHMFPIDMLDGVKLARWRFPGRHRSPVATAVSRVFSFGSILRKSRRRGAGARTFGRTRLGHLLHRAFPLALPPWSAAVFGLWGMSQWFTVRSWLPAAGDSSGDAR